MIAVYDVDKKMFCKKLAEEKNDIMLEQSHQ